MLEKTKSILLGKNKSIKILSILFIFGIILLYFSEYILSNGNTNKQTNDFDEEKYVAALEEKLSGIISKMDGVSNVNIMVTLENSESYTFLSEKTTPVFQTEASYGSSVIYSEDKSGGKAPVLSSIKSPDIKGVSVVCTGGNDLKIQYKIINLIASTLNLSKNRIFVTE